MLKLIKSYVDITKIIWNYYCKALKQIDCKWEFEATNFIRSKSLVERALKLMAILTNCQDILDLKTRTFFANI